MLKMNSISESEYRITDHARFEMNRRQISESDIEQILSNPEQIEKIRSGRVVCQSLIKLGKPSKKYLLRVFVDIDRKPMEVVTAYRTTKVKKYWRQKI